MSQNPQNNPRLFNRQRVVSADTSIQPTDARGIIVVDSSAASRRVDVGDVNMAAGPVRIIASTGATNPVEVVFDPTVPINGKANAPSIALDDDAASVDLVPRLDPTQGWIVSKGGGGGGKGIDSNDRSVNEAKTEQVGPDLVLRTSDLAPGAGAYNGGGDGNKAIATFYGFEDVPLGDLESISYTWENIKGPVGPKFTPGDPVTTTTLYVNVLVDFGGAGAVGDLYNLVLLTDQLNPTIVDSIGSYVKNGDALTGTWSAANQNVLIVGVNAPNNAPGGVAPSVSVGPSWLERSFSFAALVAANPNAKLIAVTDFVDDGGFPSGALMAAVNIMSGDSGTKVKSGKRCTAFSVNGTALVG